MISLNHSLNDDEDILVRLRQARHYQMNQKTSEEMLQNLKAQERIWTHQQRMRDRLQWLFKGALTCVVLLVPAYIVLKDRAVQQVEIAGSEQLAQQDKNERVLFRLAVLYQWVPELQQYEIESETFDEVYNRRLKHGESQQADIRIDSKTGALLWYQNNGKGLASHSQKAISESQKEGIAATFLQSMMGEEGSRYQMISRSSEMVYQQFLNGIPLLGSEVAIRVDERGKVVQYSASHGALGLRLSDLIGPDQAITAEQLQATLREQMRLRYIENLEAVDPDTGEITRTGPMLEYAPAVRFSGAVSLNAESGQIIYTSNYDRDTSRGVSPIPVSPQENRTQIKSKQEAAMFFRQVWGLPVESDIQIMEKTRDRGTLKGYKIYSWDGSGGSAMLAADPVTGKVVELSREPKRGNGRLAQEEAQREAVRYLQMYMDPTISEVQVAHTSYEKVRNLYTFTFMVSYAGIPVVKEPDQDIAYQIAVDGTTGELVAFRKNAVPDMASLQKKLPLKEEIITPEQAVTQYVKYNPFSLAYRREEGRPSPVLVYTQEYRGNQDYRIFIDAQTGKAYSAKR